MSAPEGAKRVDVGFAGGQVLSVRVQPDAYSGLQGALGNDREDRWHSLQTEDSEVMLDLAQIVYVRLDTEQHRVGF